MSYRSYTFRVVCLFALVFAVFLGWAAAQNYQARSFAITKWDGNCSGATRDWWDDMCMTWRNRMKSRGWAVWWNNFSLVRAAKFADPARVAWGKDNNWNGVDQGDASMLCTHGGHNASTGWSGLMHTNEGNGCNVNTTQMKLGRGSGGNIRFLHLSSCNSIRWSERTKWFGPAQGRIHVVTGFHGFMYIGWAYVGEYEDLANDGFSRGVARAWVDDMHHVDHWYNFYKTVCPVAVGFGATASHSANELNERYQPRWGDSVPTWMTTLYQSKCDPDDAGPLP